MYVQSEKYNVSMTGKPKIPERIKSTVQKIKQTVVDSMPEKTFNESENGNDRAKNIDSMLSHPAINRIIMGATAILTQPAIDYYNKRVDEDTRTVSRNRTIAKIIVGTGVGCIVRDSAYRLVKIMTDLDSGEKYSRKLIPKKYLQEFIGNTKRLKNYRNALSTGIAMLAMCFTNFAVDAPLTAKFTNKLNAKYEKKQNIKQETEKEVLYA